MKGKTVLITGGTGGIGKQTAIGLAKLGTQVVVTGRNRARGEAAVREIQQASGNLEVSLIISDLSSLSGVRGLAQEVKSKLGRLDVLVNNAGLLEGTRRLTADGIEAHFAVNVAVPYLLTLELLPVLGRGSRVVNLTGGMPGSHLNVDDLQAEKSFVGLMTYTRAKHAMEAMSLEMARRLEGTGISVNVVFPGSAATAMTGAMTGEFLPMPLRLFTPLFKLMMRPDSGKSAERASRSSVYAASAPELEGVTGVYLDTNSKRRPWAVAIQNDANRQVVCGLLERLTRTPSAFLPRPSSALKGATA